MKSKINVLKSLIVIIAMVTLTAGATSAVFSDSASIAGNTFSTGTLEIRINGEAQIGGASITNAKPGDVLGYGFTVYNGKIDSGAISTLDATKLTISAINNLPGDPLLFDQLDVVVRTSRTVPAHLGTIIYTGKLKNLQNADLLAGGPWSELGSYVSQDVHYTVTLPVDSGDEFQGKSANFDLAVYAEA